VARRVLPAAIALCALLSCKYPGVVGVAGGDPCAGGCAEGQHCAAELDRCVQCERDADCDAALPYCEAYECVACRAGEPCETERPPSCDGGTCPEACPDGGSCMPCEEDSDCDGSGDQTCEDGFCASEDDDESDDES